MLMRTFDIEAAWQAFERRDRSQDGLYVGAVKTTGIYCKPSCPARRPKRENVEFFETPEQACAAGYRACMRCKPDEVGRDRLAVDKAIAALDDADAPISLQSLADLVGYAPHHFQRLFTRDVGLSPAAYAKARRIVRAKSNLSK